MTITIVQLIIPPSNGRFGDICPCSFLVFKAHIIEKDSINITSCRLNIAFDIRYN